jgi:predicted metalloprotease with PDZ domain
MDPSFARPRAGNVRRAFSVGAALPLVLLLAAAALAAARGAAAAPANVAEISVDAREAPRGVLKAHLRLPVTAGAMTLLYPKWLPGRHSPAGPITSLAGPRLQAGGATLPWRRDLLDPYAFHVDIPPGVSVLDADLEVLTAPAPDGVVQGLETPRTATESLALVEWNQVVLYPAGPASDTLVYQASVVVPSGWHVATALTPVPGGATPDERRFAPVSLTTLVDSTLLTGRYWRTLDLGGTPAVRLDIAADRPALLEMAPAIEEHYRNLVQEAAALFGATHYRHYQFLWILTDQIMPDGIEHHESSDNRSPARALLDDNIRRAEANLLAHEYTHSWNGKFRRPADLATPDYQAPMRDDLLWVYEGLTEYLGDVLAARSGLLTQTEFRDELARVAAQMDIHKGREWRSLQDSTDAAPLLYYQDRNWAARLRRQDDFYQESALLWLEADTIIRRASQGRRSLDDFCRLFYGSPSTGPQVRPYDFDAVVAALDAVQPHDWRGFWLERLQRTRGGAPVQGLINAGWRYALAATPSTMHTAHEVEDHEINLQYSLGFGLSLDGGTISDIVPGSPADRAGMAPGSHLVAVDGHRWSADTVHEALAGGAATITLLVEKDDDYRSYALGYNGGERYPALVRDAGPDLLAAIGRPRRAPAAPDRP